MQYNAQENLIGIILVTNIICTIQGKVQQNMVFSFIYNFFFLKKEFDNYDSYLLGLSLFMKLIIS